MPKFTSQESLNKIVTLHHKLTLLKFHSLIVLFPDIEAINLNFILIKY